MRLRAIVLLLTALLPACAALQDTPRQAKAREEWKQCEGSVVGVRISRVEADGKTWFSYNSPSALAAAQACIAEVRAKNARPGPAASTGAQAAPPSRPPATELSVWGYTTVSETTETFNLVAYAHSKIDCEASRARDLSALERDSPWLKAKVEECRLAVVLPGSGYWTFSMGEDRMGGAGATTLEMCTRLRDEMRKQPSGRPTECNPVSVRFQGKP